MNPVEELVDAVGTWRPDAIELAAFAALALRVEPELLRVLRLELLAPRVGAAAEADLWHSHLVRSRSPQAIVLDYDVAEVLRNRLSARRADDALWPPVVRARGIVERVHRHISPALALEEEVIWLSVSGAGVEQIDRALYRALAGLASGDRRGLSDWAASAWGRLPERARGSHAGVMMRQIEMARREGPVALRSAADGDPDLDLAVLLAGSERVRVGVRRNGADVELGDVQRDGAWALSVPDTEPRVVEVLWTGPDGARQAVDVAIAKHAVERVEVGSGDVQLRNVLDEIYDLPAPPSDPTASAPPSQRDLLLRRFQPHLRYDSNEQFFADSAAQFTEAPGLELRRQPEGGSKGALIASADPSGSEPKLTLAFLGPARYGDGTPVLKTDVIGVSGSDYRTQYVRLRTARPDLNNRVYGRAVEVNGHLWLQYWFWYFYNDYQLALGFGTFEGDWEMIQLRMAFDGDVPDGAVYAQHRYGEKRNWEDVERLEGSADTPVVYVARGSHASYFEAGFHQTEAWYDVADGKRNAAELALEIVRPGEHDWMLWPGRWGATTPRERSADLDQSSPSGPGTRRSWSNPDAALDSARAPKHRDPPRAPDVRITRDAERMQIDYDFTARTVRPVALVVTVSSRNEKGVPPMTHTFTEVASKPKGTLRTNIPVRPARHYDVYTSTVSGDPPIASASRFTELDAIEQEYNAPLQAVAKTIGGIFARLRGDR